MNQTAIIFVAVLFMAIIAYLIWYLFARALNAKGRGAEKRTTRILSRFALLRRYKVLTETSVTDKDGTAQLIENMMIGPFGVLLVVTRGAFGEYYGRPGDAKWTVVQEKKGRQAIESPVLLLEHQEAALRHLLIQNNIYNVPVEKVVYLSGPPKRTTIYVTAASSCVVLPGGKLAGYLEKPVFEKENGVDPEKIAALLGEEA